LIPPLQKKRNHKNWPLLPCPKENKWGFTLPNALFHWVSRFIFHDYVVPQFSPTSRPHFHECGYPFKQVIDLS